MMKFYKGQFNTSQYKKHRNLIFIQFLLYICHSKQTMLKKAKVVNIQFQHILNHTVKSQSSQSSQNTKLHPQRNLQSFIRSPQSTSETYELLSILRNRPVSLAQITQKRQIYDDLMDFENKKNIRENIRIREMESFAPIASESQAQTNLKQSIEAKMSGTSSTFMNTHSGEDIVRQSGNEEDGKNSAWTRSGFCNTIQNEDHKMNNDEQTEQFVYMIPEKYASGLYLILINFLSYKMAQAKEAQSKTPNLNRRPRTTLNKITDQNVRQATRDSKPLTAVCLSLITQQTSTVGQDLTSHLQKLIQMEKELEKKSKRVMLLENQLSSCYQAIHEKNAVIKELSQRQGIMRKKLKCEVGKIAKSKVMEEINQIYVKSVCQQKASGRGLFEINGKKFAKSDIFQNFIESPFLTSPKASFRLTDKQNIPKMAPVQAQKCEIKSKNPSINPKKPQLKGVNRKLQTMKLTKQLDNLAKEIIKFEAQRENLLDDLTENNIKIERNIEDLEATIMNKKISVERCRERLIRLNQPGCHDF